MHFLDSSCVRTQFRDRCVFIRFAGDEGGVATIWPQVINTDIQVCVGSLRAQWSQQFFAGRSAVTGGNRIKANKTIYKSFARRTRTKKTSTFKPSELNGNQIAADKVVHDYR